MPLIFFEFGIYSKKCLVESVNCCLCAIFLTTTHLSHICPISWNALLGELKKKSLQVVVEIFGYGVLQCLNCRALGFFEATCSAPRWKIVALPSRSVGWKPSRWNHSQVKVAICFRDYGYDKPRLMGVVLSIYFPGGFNEKVLVFFWKAIPCFRIEVI